MNPSKTIENYARQPMRGEWPRQVGEPLFLANEQQPRLREGDSHVTGFGCR